MALVHEFEKTGNWLFKRRSWLPVFLIIAGFILMYYVNRQAILFDPEEEICFLGISLLGQAVRVLTIGFTPRNTSGRNTNHGQIADELNVTGIYSLLRHPLYLGNFFMWLGPSLFLRYAWFTVVFCLIYWLYYERIMFAEEQYLRRKFGEDYDKWCESVRAILPVFNRYIPSNLPFSVKTVLKREHNTFANIFIMFAALDLVRNWIISGRIHLTSMWMYLLIGAGLVWIIIRVIHKTTRWLTVEGR